MSANSKTSQSNPIVLKKNLKSPTQKQYITKELTFVENIHVKTKWDVFNHHKHVGHR